MSSISTPAEEQMQPTLSSRKHSPLGNKTLLEKTINIHISSYRIADKCNLGLDLRIKPSALGIGSAV